jgi:oligoendopeptidase F
LLRAGGSLPPQELGAIVGVDLSDPGFWSSGLDLVERQLDAAEAAAGDAGRLT